MIETFDWLDKNQLAEKEDFEAKLKEMEDVVNPIMMKVYQAAGGDGTPEGDLPDGDFGGNAIDVTARPAWADAEFEFSEAVDIFDDETANQENMILRMLKLANPGMCEDSDVFRCLQAQISEQLRAS